MDIRTQSNHPDPNRVSVLVMQAESFEEERILTAIVDAITSGGMITTEVPTGNGDETRCLDFHFEPMKKKKRRKDG